MQPRKGKTVLVVEDEEVIRFLVHELLDYHGYAVLEACEGREAFRLARKHHPDLVLMDIELPEHSGLEVTRWLKEDESLCDIPVVAVTAYALRGERQRMAESGCDAYLAKPFSSNDFIATVERTIADLKTKLRTPGASDSQSYSTSICQPSA